MTNLNQKLHALSEHLQEASGVQMAVGLVLSQQ